MADAMGPWWIGIGTGIVSALIGTIGKLWSELASVRRESKAEIEAARFELSEANERILHLQDESNLRGDGFQREHVRDLRRLAGLSTSVEPTRPSPWPPVIVRASKPFKKQS
jgi:hypothetical protein